jgi:hypothetical protein
LAILVNFRSFVILFPFGYQAKSGNPDENTTYYYRYHTHVFGTYPRYLNRRTFYLILYLHQLCLCFHVEYILKQKSSIISHDNTLSGDKVAGDNDFGFVPRCFRTRQTRKYGALGVAPVARQVGKVGPAAAAAVVGLASAGHDVAVVRFYVMKVAGGSIPRKRVIHQGMSYSILNNVFEFNIEIIAKLKADKSRHDDDFYKKKIILSKAENSLCINVFLSCVYCLQCLRQILHNFT